MLIMVDDVQLASDEVFYPFMSNSLGLGNDGISDPDKLFDILSEFDKDDVEIIVHDLDDVAEERKKAAKKLVGVFMDAKFVNKKLKVTFKND